MKFRVLNGKHLVFDEEGNKTVLTAGNVVESSKDLVKLFRGRFQRVNLPTIDPNESVVSIDPVSPLRKEAASVCDVGAASDSQPRAAKKPIRMTTFQKLMKTGQDVTTSFKNVDGLAVIKHSKGYAVVDASSSEVLTDRSLRSKKRVQEWIDDNMGVAWES